MPLLKTNLGTTHQCNLPNHSNSCLPKLAPQTGKLRRCLREFRKSLMVSHENANSKWFFRSQAAINAEKKRQVRTGHFYIIHPFSKLCVRREMLICVLWMYTFLNDPFATAFFSTSATPHTNGYMALDFYVDIVLLFNVTLCFITGIHKVQTKEVVLDRCKIAKQYATTYFFFDFFGSVPFRYILKLFYNPNIDADVYDTMLSCSHFLRFIRIKTAFQYFRRITEFLGVEDSIHHLITLVLLSCYVLHWWACLIYIVPLIQYELQNNQLSNYSWVVKAGIEPGRKNISISMKYIQCLLSTFCHFHSAGMGMFISEEPWEQIMFGTSMLTGLFFTSYILVVVLQMVNSASSSESKYEELINQLGEYMRRKKLPIHIQDRLILYYENRFKKHYFKEQAILNTLSEHLRYEIFLYGCKALVEKVSVFHGLSKTTIGAIVAGLKHEVFLPNDVILKAGVAAESMYFISYGTVACITLSGKELCHLEDGDHFGEVSFFIQDTIEQHSINVIALEITEVFKLDKRDLERCMYQDDEIADRLEKVANERLAEMEALEHEEVYDESKQRRDVLQELRRGRILEHSRGKRRINI